MADLEASILNFSGGYITEVSALNFPPNATVDERNMVLLNDGTRRRRLGIDFETDYGIVDTKLPNTFAKSVYRWEDANEIAGQHILVVQVGRNLYFHDLLGGSISGSPLGSIWVGQEDFTEFSFTSADGYLVVATGSPTVYYVGYKNNTFDLKTYRLLVRDIFGVTDFYNVRERDTLKSGYLDRGNNILFRPEQLTKIHEYNLYNQGWPKTKSWCFYGEMKDKIKDKPLDYCATYFRQRSVIDPNSVDKEAFLNEDGTVVPVTSLFANTPLYPSNSDIFARFSTIGTAEPSTANGFNPDIMEDGLHTSAYSPIGKHIIDLFRRGEGRKTISGISSLPTDFSTGGVKNVEEYSGRVFYSGFDGEIEGGDDRSPNLSSYIAFTQLIEYPEDFKLCYQEADPTDVDDSAVVATDGGLIRVSGAKGIVHMQRVSDSLVIFATNGIWQLIGSRDFGFSADNYQLIEITDKGLISPKSVVDIGGILLYWSEDGIYRLVPSPDTGLLISEDIGKGTIQSLLDKVINKAGVFGSYDSFDKTARWVFDGNMELVFRPDIQAFSLNEFQGTNPTVLDYITTSPYNKQTTEFTVVVGGDTVVVGGDIVGLTSTKILSDTKELKYLTQVADDTFSYTFSQISNTDFLDWEKYDGVGVDAKAYMITGGMAGNDPKTEKQIPYLFTYFHRTEEEIVDIDGDWQPSNQSSCLTTVYWGWADSINSNKWTAPFQTYRYRRHYVPPTGLGDPYDTGFSVIHTKNKIRGRGKSISIKFETEPKKDLRILGWIMGIDVVGNL